MIQYYNVQANTQVTITTVISGITNPTDLSLLKDGSIDTTPVVFTNLLTSGLCKFVFTPTSTGVYTLYGQASILAAVEVVTRSPLSYLKNIEDESIGSWQWNKTTGVMTMVKQDGTQLAQFNVLDNITTSSRERI